MRLFVVSAAALVLVAAACFSATAVHAAVTDNSVLSCETADVLPGQNVSCLVYLRDELQEPTTSSTAESVFSVRVVSDIAEAVVTVSPVAVTHDPTVVRFTVASAMGTRLRVDAYVSDTGLPVRNTGAVVLVLETPPTRFGDIFCDCGKQLAFRATTRCVVQATGARGLPAFVVQSNFFLSEEHGDGAFKFLSGTRSLEFTYTAPTYPSMAYTTFIFHLGLLSPTSSASVQMETSLALNVVYPSTSVANAFSRLRCGAPTQADASTGAAVAGDASRDVRRCFVSALDVLGPIAFTQDDFDVTVMRRADDGSGGVLVTASEISWSWLPGGNAGVAVISFTLNQDARVFDGIVNVRLRRGDAAGKPILGSPATMSFGVAPTVSDLRLVKCARGFTGSGASVLCYVSVAPGATADPAFVAASAEAGAIAFKYVNNDTAATDADVDLKGKRLIIFSYKAPVIAGKERVVDRISVFAVSTDAAQQKIPVAGSPVEIAVYPKKFVEPESDTRLAAAIAGFFLFVPVLAVGVYFNIKHAQKQARSLQRLLKHQQHQAETTRTRPLFRMPASANPAVDVDLAPPAEDNNSKTGASGDAK